MALASAPNKLMHSRSLRPTQPSLRITVWEGAGDRGCAAGHLQPAVDVLQMDAHGSFRYA
jgi:hypothetical protein